MASSTDGYCSFLVFEEDELGLKYEDSTTEKEGVKKIIEDKDVMKESTVEE